MKLVGEWDRLERTLNPREFGRRLDKSLGLAMERIGRRFAGNARRAIQLESYAPNSPITVILKGSSKPLVDEGDLDQGITYQVVTPRLLRVGVIRGRAGADGEVVNIAGILHEGATVDVRKHPKVRIKVWAMVREALGKVATLHSKRSQAAVRGASDNLGDGGGTSGASHIWRIPARPYLAEPLNDPAFVRYARGQWSEAVRWAIFGR